ncbi:MAG: DUF2273 domain-containing protein [Clostridia bacterium]|nr:DUF2273 domain-containing protein [Clostridia bacterium]
MLMERLQSFFRQNKWAVLLALAGLVLMILFFTVGFFKTIIVLAVVAFCFFIGGLMDKGGIEEVKNFFKRLF